MDKKILITYASKCGSTGEVAKALGEAVGQHIAVDVKPVQSVESLAGYSAVIIGSAVRYGAWLKEASGFVKAHQAELAQLPTAIFSVHMNNRADTDEARQARAAYTAPIHAVLSPTAEVFFSGVIDPKKLTVLEKMMMKAVKSEVGDFRDWETINAWGETTAAAILP